MNWYLDTGQDSDVVISSRIRLARNIKNYPFPRRMSVAKANECYGQISDLFFSLNRNLSKEFLEVKIRELPPLTAAGLVEKRLFSEDFLKTNEASRALINKDENIAILLGEEDHIRIQAMMPGSNIYGAYAEAEKIALLFEQNLPLAFDPRYGFLTACPTNTGTGLRASFMLHLSGLAMTGMLNRYIEACHKAGLAVRGQYGENSKATGHLYQISNQYTLGLSESESIEEVLAVIKQLVAKEREARQILWQRNKVGLTDQVYRSYGLLTHAFSITSEEAQIHLSNIRLSQNFGLFKPFSVSVLNELAIAIGPANLQKTVGKVLDEQERDQARAKLLRDTLTLKVKPSYLH